MNTSIYLLKTKLYSTHLIYSYCRLINNDYQEVFIRYKKY